MKIINQFAHQGDTQWYQLKDLPNGLKKVEKQFFKNSQTIEGARRAFFETDNEDVKAAIITIIKENHGQEGLMNMLNAVMVDEQIINHYPGYSETVRLYKTKERYDFLQDHHGNMNQPYCWSEMKCPSTGSTYLIENSAAFENAVDAVKFLRPSFIPFDLNYKWEHSAN